MKQILIFTTAIMLAFSCFFTFPVRAEDTFEEAVANADEYLRDLREGLKGLNGEWYSTEICIDKESNEKVPARCIVINDNLMDYYDYDKTGHCYVRSGTKEINYPLKTDNGYAVIVGDYEENNDTPYIIFESDENDPYLMNIIVSMDFYYEGKDLIKAGSVISPKSADFGDYFEKDCTGIEKTGDNSVSRDIPAPEVKDVVPMTAIESYRYHFMWEPVDGADGYIVCEERCGSPSDILYPTNYISVKDHFYVYSDYPSYPYKISFKVRAYKGEGADRVYGEWSDHCECGYPYDWVENTNDDVRFEAGTQGAGRAQCEDYYSPLIGDYYKIFNKESEYGLRAPYEFYYEVNDKFDTLDINNAYYAFYEMTDGYDHPGLVFLKKTDKGDCIYSAYSPEGCIMNYRGGSPDEKEGEELYFYDKGTIAFVRNVNGYEYISYFRPYFEGEHTYYKFIVTLVKEEYDSGQYRYYISYDRESGEDFSSHDYNIYMDSTKEEYDEIRSKYEKPAEIEKIPLTEFAGK